MNIIQILLDFWAFISGKITLGGTSQKSGKDGFSLPVGVWFLIFGVAISFILYKLKVKVPFLTRTKTVVRRARSRSRRRYTKNRR